MKTAALFLVTATAIAVANSETLRYHQGRDVDEERVVRRTSFFSSITSALHDIKGLIEGDSENIWDASRYAISEGLWDRSLDSARKLNGFNVSMAEVYLQISADIAPSGKVHATGPLASILPFQSMSVRFPDFNDTHLDNLTMPSTVGGIYSTSVDLAVITVVDNTCVVGFRYTNNPSGWFDPIEGDLAMFAVGWRKMKSSSGSFIANVHAPFYNAYQDLITNTGLLNGVGKCLQQFPKLVITGESRGAALAQVMALHLVSDEGLDYDAYNPARTGGKVFDFSKVRDVTTDTLSVYSSAAPKVLSIGMESDDYPVILKQYEKFHNIRNFRIINKLDMVTGGPPSSFYHHFGRPINIVEDVNAQLNIPASTLYPTQLDSDFPSTMTGRSLGDHNFDGYVAGIKALRRRLNLACFVTDC